MRARAEAAGATRERILASARALLVSHSFDTMTVEAIAKGADTTVRTVLRIFSSKEELFAEALHSLGEIGQAPIIPGDAAASIEGLYVFYEKVGDTVIRWLADEPRVPALHEHLQIGRQHFRAWIGEAFAPALARLSGPARRELHDALIAALDVYTWKLLRRDIGLSHRAAAAVVRRMVTALTAENKHGEDPVAELVRRRQSSAKPRHRPRADRTRA